MAYFNNAATTFPKPEEVYTSMELYFRGSTTNSGRGGNRKYNADGLIEETRHLVQRILNCSGKQVVFEPSATLSLNIIIQGVILSGAKVIYISPFEHNSVTRILHNYEQKGKIEVHQLFVNESLEFDLERIQYQFDSKKPDFVILSHASNVIGLIAPAIDIFKLAKKYNAVTLLDMAQTAGLVKCDIGSSCVDYAVFAGHKTLLGPTGISGYVMKPEIKLDPILFGGTGIDSANQDMPEGLPQRFEIGTQNILGLAGLNAALKWIESKSIDEIRKKDNENRYKLISLLQSYWFVKLIGLNKEREYIGVISCLIEGISSDSAGNIFERYGIVVRTGLQCAPLAHKFLGTFPAGTIRFSVGYFTSDEDFNSLKHALDYIESNL